jgi:hypothetical protein
MVKRFTGRIVTLMLVHFLYPESALTADYRLRTRPSPVLSGYAVQSPNLDLLRIWHTKYQRKGYLIWDGLQLGSGFDVKIMYDKRVSIDGGIIGINDEYDLTPALARFLALNHSLIHSRVGGIEDLLAGYRQFCQQECNNKGRGSDIRFPFTSVRPSDGSRRACRRLYQARA